MSDESTAEPLNTPPPIHARNAATCRWATPTLFLSPPYWLGAEDCPWACVREALPRVLATTDECGRCPQWQPRVVEAVTRERNRLNATWTDWFAAFLPPHEAQR